MNNIKTLRRALSSPKYVLADQQILHEKVKVKGVKKEQHRQIVCEKAIDYLCCKFEEKNDNLFPYFNEIHGLRSMCDYVLFAQRGNEFYVFAIEMKNSSGSPELQTLYAEPFIRFILDRTRVVMHNLDSSFQFRRIGIKDSYANHKTNRKKTKIANEMHYNADSYLLLDDSKYFRIGQLMDLPVY